MPFDGTELPAITKTLLSGRDTIARRGWVQHMYASLKDGGRMAVVLDTGAVSRGSGNQGSNRERDRQVTYARARLRGEQVEKTLFGIPKPRPKIENSRSEEETKGGERQDAPLVPSQR